MKSILLSASNDAEMASRLSCALDISRRCDAHLTLLQAQPYQDYVALDMFGGAYVMSELLERSEAMRAETREKWEVELANEDVRWDWRDAVGRAEDLLVETSHFMDLIVVSLSASDSVQRGNVGEIVLDSRRPVLVVPPQCKGMQLDRAMIAYDGSAESANAIRGALPLLKLAETVVVVEVEEKQSTFPMTDAVSYLAQHGVSCEVQQLSNSALGIAETLLDFAKEFRADYLVMGAYGHSRLRQTLFGGVTRHMLSAVEVPMVLAS